MGKISIQYMVLRFKPTTFSVTRVLTRNDSFHQSKRCYDLASRANCHTRRKRKKEFPKIEDPFILTLSTFYQPFKRTIYKLP